MAEDVQELFARIREFDWDPKKRESNLRDKKIDFVDVRGIFGGETYIRRSDRHGEIRYQVFGYIHEQEASVICTIRSEVCWLISARRASRAERRKYHANLSRRSPTRQD